MAFNIDENGNITLIQGDSGSLVINGLKTDKNYTVFLQFKTPTVNLSEMNYKLTQIRHRLLFLSSQVILPIY